MARKLRLEYPGAVYHVINRGNYRAWVFRDAKTKAAFESCLFDACRRYGWELHAFVLMGNHYHLALETPQGNLVAGMHWLQATFANRFNRLRGEHGHLFQGRYKALPVEDGEGLGHLCHYIHLNPVRAGIVPAGQLATYRYSSYWYLWRPKARPACLSARAGLGDAGQLPDTPAGWRVYQQYLEWQAEEGPAGKNPSYVSLTQGWMIGSAEFKRALVQDHAVAAIAQAWGTAGAREVKQARWEALLARVLQRVPSSALAATAKCAPWKVAAAAHLKATSDVANGWLAERLSMGSAAYVSKHVGLARRQPPRATAALLKKVKGET